MPYPDPPDIPPPHHHHPDRYAQVKQSGVCPLCLSKLEKTRKGGRYQWRCSACSATRRRDLLCGSCGTHRVWYGKLGAVCKGCGKAVTL